MADETEEDVKMLVGIMFQQINASGQPHPLGAPLLGMPGESMEQLAGRLQNSMNKYSRDYAGLGYIHTAYLGELTHELAPPPPPPPVPISKIKQLPTAMTGRKSASPLKKALKQVVVGR